MGRDLHYKPGSFYRVDDRTGFPTRAERTRKEWNGLLVDEKVWEARQPQDLVKGVPDNQSVPEPRPLAPNMFVGPVYLTLQAAYGPGANVLAVDSLAGVTIGQKVSVMFNDGTQLFTHVTAIGAGTITIAKPLADFAADGNLVTVDLKNGAVIV